MTTMRQRREKPFHGWKAIKKEKNKIKRDGEKDLENPSGVDNPRPDVPRFRRFCQLESQRLITCRNVVGVEE